MPFCLTVCSRIVVKTPDTGGVVVVIVVVLPI
jgi:hypothetical protein